MQQNKALGGLLVAVLAFAKFGLALGGSNTCTPSTCTGPVYVSFTTENCSGEPTFYQVDRIFGVCNSGTIFQIEEHGLSQYTVHSDLVTCNYTAANATYDLYFDVWGMPAELQKSDG
jgi:hypothetical protein